MAEGKDNSGWWGLLFLILFVIFCVLWVRYNLALAEAQEGPVLTPEQKQVMKESDEGKAKQAELAAWRFTEELPDRLAEDLDRAERAGQPTKMLEYKLQEAIKRRDEQRARLKSK